MRINLLAPRRTLEAHVLTLLRTKGACYAENIVCALRSWAVVPMLNSMRQRGMVTFHVVPPWWDEPFVVVAGHPAEWPRVNRALVGMRGTIGRVRFARHGRATVSEGQADGGDIERRLRLLGGSRCVATRARTASTHRAPGD